VIGVTLLVALYFWLRHPVFDINDNQKSNLCSAIMEATYIKHIFIRLISGESLF
jgi:hypothetical protein